MPYSCLILQRCDLHNSVSSSVHKVDTFSSKINIFIIESHEPHQPHITNCDVVTANKSLKSEILMVQLIQHLTMKSMELILYNKCTCVRHHVWTKFCAHSNLRLRM